jgi:predicted transcriptional regulator of viral defense system
MGKQSRDEVFNLIKQEGAIRPRDLEARGLSRHHLWWLYQAGLLNRVGRGIYVPKDADPTEMQTLAEASKRFPQGVICLLSALRFHGLTAQAPSAIWMAIDTKARLPKEDQMVMKFVRFSGKALAAGIEQHQLGGITIQVFNPAKTVSDCFKYRNKIGLDVALEALKDGLKQNRCSMDDLWGYAQICRVQNVMKPYLYAVA